jgi:uncharacterized protein
MLPARRCAECGRLSVNAATCRYCGAEGGEAINLSGRGRLVSWTVIRVAPARYASDAPYAVGLLELAEGPRITARLEGDPDRLTAGQPMGLVSIDPARGPVFR